MTKVWENDIILPIELPDKSRREVQMLAGRVTEGAAQGG